MNNDVGRVPMDEPLGYLLTWTTYGSWLPGDARGWVSKPGQFRAPDKGREVAARQRMTEPAVTLDIDQRQIVEDTIAAHCRIRGWHLHVVNARTEHVHVVVTAPGRKPDDVMDQFKAWCTRKLGEHERARITAAGDYRQDWWTQGGSKRWLNDGNSLEAAILYVREGQGEPTPRPAVAREDTNSRCIQA
jgi:hypothetical protein